MIVICEPILFIRNLFIRVIYLLETVPFLKRLPQPKIQRKSTSEHDLHLHIFTPICKSFIKLACTLFCITFTAVFTGKNVYILHSI